MLGEQWRGESNRNLRGTSEPGNMQSKVIGIEDS